MKNVFLCPGQGSQLVGMGKDLAEVYPRVRELYDTANEILGFNLAEICFQGPEDELKKTRATQPALYVHSYAIGELLAERGVKADVAAGHSLGEYSALAIAGAFSFETGLKLVKVRAESMQKAGEQNPGTMAAFVGLDPETVETICQEAAAEGTIVPANFNSPGQIAVSGSIPAVERAVSLAKDKKARLAQLLPVSGAFHSPLMEPAAKALAIALESAEIQTPEIYVISNVTARPHGSPSEIRELLAKQLLSPVRWMETLQYLACESETQWYEVGAGKVLAGLLKRTIKDAVATSIGTTAALEGVGANS
ncbi:ACP S-malonyltransferase [bacterium]|nr:ACP S-malonyltransferase [bacterium]MBU1937936.1 ACP S-malonyltransferase [bacterium]